MIGGQAVFWFSEGLGLVSKKLLDCSPSKSSHSSHFMLLRVCDDCEILSVCKYVQFSLDPRVVEIQ